VNFPSPIRCGLARNEVLLDDLDYWARSRHRESHVTPPGRSDRERVPTDWTGLELVKHSDVRRDALGARMGSKTRCDEPWGDPSSVIVGTSLPEDTLDSLVGALRSRGIQSAEIVQRL